jgi:transketolase
MAHIDSKEVERLARMPGRDVYGTVLAEIGKEHEDVVVLGADCFDSCRCIEFQKRFPERSFNIGIAEANMVGIAAGLAVSGKTPFVNTFGFLLSMRACEQVRTDICYPNLNVKLVTSMFGLIAGTAGTTHHATEDIAIMRSFPNMTVIEAADGFEVMKAVNAALGTHGPVYLRVGRDTVPVYKKDYAFEVGKSVQLRDGEDVAIIASGIMVSRALEAADRLAEKGIGVRIINMHTIKPIDRESIVAARHCRMIVTAEEHSSIGGLGSAVAEIMAEEGLGIPLRRIGIKDVFCGIGPTQELRKKHGLTSDDMMKVIEASMAS